MMYHVSPCAEQNGIVGVWRMDTRGKLVQMCNFNKQGAITHVAFAKPITSEDKP